MSLTVQQMVLDAKKLVKKLKESDSAADSLITRTESAYKLLDTRRQYAEDSALLNHAAGQKPHSVFVANIEQESRHLRQLQKENRELRAALDEYDIALEMIMSKYRQQVTRILASTNIDSKELLEKRNYLETRSLAEKIQEMAAVMNAAVKMDEDSDLETAQDLARLTLENQGLRQMLNLSRRYNPATPPPE